MSNNIPSLVRSQFKAAQKSGDLTFYSTQVCILLCDNLPFQLRFSPSLANKPKLDGKDKKDHPKPTDPFENPTKELYITDLGPAHYLVLNKYPVIPNHFILATTKFKEQTDLLEEQDIGAAYKCLQAYRKNGEELFGFFNSGDHSGASQPHRHIQFLPVESMRTGIEDDSEWGILADKLVDKNDVPFECFVSKVPENATSSQLHQIYTKMYKDACQLSEKYSNTTQSAISYNIGLTDRSMVLCPRTSEGPTIKSLNGKILGPIALNGTILGGTMLVKSEEEWNTLKSDTSKLKGILSAIGISRHESNSSQRL